MVIEFFHDVLCAWCFAISPRVRRLVDEFPEIEVKHRSFALAPRPLDIASMFGSKEKGKQEIINHWRAANQNDDDHRIHADLMETRAFDYPYSMPGLMACKAAEMQDGPDKHWDYFDSIQKAHLTECRNIVDPEVLIECARDIGLDMDRFREDYQSERAENAVSMDIGRAMELGINSVPTLVCSAHILSGAQRYKALREWYLEVKS